jgi:PhnB protein
MPIQRVFEADRRRTNEEVVMAVKPIPDGYHTVTPYIVASGASNLIEFMKRAFGAEELFRMTMPDGSVKHAEIKIGNSILMLAEASAEHPAMPITLYLYVEDCDAVYKSALAAGGVSVMPPTNQYYGDRSGGVKDASGNQWWVGTHIEDVSPEELKKRSQAMQKA